MTLCFFSAQYLPTVGGVERYTFNLAKRAVQAGHRVLVVTSALPGLPQEETDDLVFAEEVFGGSVPKNFFPAVEKGLR